MLDTSFLKRLGLLSMITVISIIIHAYIFMELWEWFVVTTFDTSPLSMAQSAGLITMIALLGNKVSAQEYKDDNEIFKLFLNLIINSFLILFYGWLIKLFM